MNTNEFRSMARKWVDDNLPEDTMCNTEILTLTLSLLLLDAYSAGIDRVRELITNS